MAENRSWRLWQVDAAGIAFCAALTLAAYFAVARPFVQARAASAALETQLSEQKQKASELGVASRSVRQRLNEAQQALATAPVKLQSPRGLNARIAELTALASGAGLEVQFVRTSALVPGLRYSEMPIELCAVGDYRTCATFLHELKHELPDTGVRAFHLADQGGETARSAMFTFQLIWYVEGQGKNDKATR